MSYMLKKNLTFFHWYFILKMKRRVTAAQSN